MNPDQMHTCIEACNQCAVECERCAMSCLGEEDVRMLARCITLDLECAALCRTAVVLMSRGSERSADLCQVCAEACDQCAEECERHAHMEHCRKCAEECRRCAEECRRMARQGGAGRQSTRTGEHAAH